MAARQYRATIAALRYIDPTAYGRHDKHDGACASTEARSSARLVIPMVSAPDGAPVVVAPRAGAESERPTLCSVTRTNRVCYFIHLMRTGSLASRWRHRSFVW